MAAAAAVQIGVGMITVIGMEETGMEETETVGTATANTGVIADAMGTAVTAVVIIATAIAIAIAHPLSPVVVERIRRHRRISLRR